MFVNCLIEKISIVGWEFQSEQWIWNPFSPVGATREWPGDTLDSDKWLFPSPFILFTIQRLSLNKTLFYSPCFWLLCLNEPICWRTPPGRTWSITRTDVWLQHFFFPGRNQVLQKRTEIHSKAFQCLPLHQNSCDTSQSLGQQGSPSIYFHSRFLFADSVWKQVIMTQIREQRTRTEFVTAVVNVFMDTLYSWTDAISVAWVTIRNPGVNLLPNTWLAAWQGRMVQESFKHKFRKV